MPSWGEKLILHPAERKNQATQEEYHLEADTLSKRLEKSNLPELGIKRVYLFKCILTFYILYVGQLIPFNRWNKRMK